MNTTKTATIPGRYNLGTTLYFASPAIDRQVLRTERRAMTAEQVAALTTVRVIEIRTASETKQITAEMSEGSVGLGESSVVEFI
jgi:hypothetical protein